MQLSNLSHVYLSAFSVFLYLKITLTAENKAVISGPGRINTSLGIQARWTLSRSALLWFRKGGPACGSPGGLELSVLCHWTCLLLCGCPLAQSLGLILPLEARLNPFLSTHPRKAWCLQRCEPRIQTVCLSLPHNLPVLGNWVLTVAFSHAGTHWVQTCWHWRALWLPQNSCLFEKARGNL